MRVSAAVLSIQRSRSAGGWVRLEEVRRFPGGLEITFSIYNGKRGKRIDTWQFTCLRVHEAQISAWDGGGLCLYSTAHPAARQYSARKAEVRWGDANDMALVIGTLYKAHANLVDDWIPFDRYSSIRAVSKGKNACRGPEFLMRAYAKALRSIGKEPHVLLRRSRRTTARAQVLHFGDSFLVADDFVADHYLPKS